MPRPGENAVAYKKKSLGSRILANRQMYLLLVFSLAWYAIFAYAPMYGLTLAFKTFRAADGVLGSPWVGFRNYDFVFRDPAFLKSVWTTLIINGGRLVFQFPVPILLALLLNELRMGRFKRVLQSIYTFPHFLSWVVVASILINVLGRNGLANSIIRLLGAQAYPFLGTPSIFRALLFITENWKSVGWVAIIYMASIAGISQEQYESAEIDGASRLQRVVHITLPGISTTVTVMFILTVGNLMTMGFDQIFNLSNPATYKVAETLDMYIYRITFQSATDFSFSTAVALFRSVANFVLLLSADRLSKLVGGGGLFR